MSNLSNRYASQISDGSRPSDIWGNIADHVNFFEAKLQGTVIYTLTFLNTGPTLMMSFDTSSNTPGLSYSISIPQGTFLDNQSGTM